MARSKSKSKSELPFLFSNKKSQSVRRVRCQHVSLCGCVCVFFFDGVLRDFVGDSVVGAVFDFNQASIYARARDGGCISRYIAMARDGWTIDEGEHRDGINHDERFNIKRIYMNIRFSGVAEQRRFVCGHVCVKVKSLRTRPSLLLDSMPGIRSTDPSSLRKLERKHFIRNT